MDRASKEFQAFDFLMGKLLTVPKSTIRERQAARKGKVTLNLMKRDPTLTLPA